MVRPDRRIALWLFDHVPLGRFAPWMLGYVLGSRPRRVDPPED